MTPEQLDSIINHYKRKAVRAYNNDDTFTCNRMIKIVHELEGNYDEYLEQEFADDHLELYFDIILPKATAMNSLFFSSDPYDRGNIPISTERQLIYNRNIIVYNIEEKKFAIQNKT